MAGAGGEGETGNRGLRPEPVDVTGLMGPVQDAFLRQATVVLHSLEDRAW